MNEDGKRKDKDKKYKRWREARKKKPQITKGETIWRGVYTKIIRVRERFVKQARLFKWKRRFIFWRPKLKCQKRSRLNNELNGRMRRKLIHKALQLTLRVKTQKSQEKSRSQKRWALDSIDCNNLNLKMRNINSQDLRNKKTHKS